MQPIRVNELSELALKWLEVFVASRKNPSQASKELGHAPNWAGRLIKRKEPVNWDFRYISEMAENLGIGAVQLFDAIRAGIAPAGKPQVKKPRAKPRRAQREPGRKESYRTVRTGVDGG